MLIKYTKLGSTGKSQFKQTIRLILTGYCFRVPNAMSGRDNLDIEIFGMEGIPEEDLIAYEAKILGASNAAKKSKSGGSGQYGELTLEEMQQQMAAHKAGNAPAGPGGGAAPAAAPAVVPPTIPTPTPVTSYAQPPVAGSHYYNPAFGVPPPQAGYGGAYPYPNPYYPPAQPNYGYRPPPG
jgi:hypothetical protein